MAPEPGFIEKTSVCIDVKSLLISVSLYMTFLGTGFILFPVTLNTGYKVNPLDAIAITCSRQNRSVDTVQGLQFVDGLKSPLYVYSALRNGNDLRIVAIKAGWDELDSLFCVVCRNSPDSVTEVMKASFTLLPESSDSFYKAAYITCHNTGTQKTDLEISASGTRRASETSTTRVNLFRAGVNRTLVEFIPVEGQTSRLEDTSASPSTKDKSSSQMVDFTVCVQPMPGYFNDKAKVVEMIELSRLMGAGRIVFYNLNTSPGVDAIFKWYQERRNTGDDRIFLTTRPFQFTPVTKPSKLFTSLDRLSYTDSETAAVEDCLYLNRFQSRYIIFTSIDEFIVPLRHNDWSELIAYRQSINPKAKAFTFRQTYIDKNIPSPAEGFGDAARRYKSTVLRYTRRHNFTTSVRQTMLIVDPRHVKDRGLYDVLNPGDVESVPVEDGLVFHYRNFIDPPANTSVVAENRATDLFGKRLAEKLNHVWSSIDLKRKK